MLDLTEARRRNMKTEILVEKEGDLTCIILEIHDKGKLKVRDCRKYDDNDIAILKEKLNSI